jgi:hypothetical protein
MGRGGGGGGGGGEQHYFTQKNIITAFMLQLSDITSQFCIAIKFVIYDLYTMFYI